jgi:hypothetical protein
MEVTSLEQLKLMAECDVLELPRFKPDMPFIVKAKRPSLLELIRQGKVPNKLLSAAEELFYGKQASRGVELDQLASVMNIMAESALVEPSMEDLNSVELKLTDEQLIYLFNYSQKGLNAIQPFSTKSEDNVNTGDVQAVQTETESNNKYN